VEFCAEVMPSKDRATLGRAFDELVLAGLTAVSGAHHRLRQETIRDIVIESLAAPEREHLHATIGLALMARARLPDDAELDKALSDANVSVLDTALKAGLHLVSGGQRARGSEILRAACWELTLRGEGLAEAVPTLEAALQVYRAQNRSKYERAY